MTVATTRASRSHSVRVHFECNVIDISALWNAAALRATTDFAMTPDDVVETIGPREDPAIEECIAMLLDPMFRHSGIFDAIEVTAVPPAGGTPSATYPAPPVAEPSTRDSIDRSWMRAPFAT